MRTLLFFRSLKRRSLILAAVSLSSLAVLGTSAYCLYLQYVGNFHIIEEGMAYRSNQPTPARLRDYAQNYRIKTIVNLRGENPQAQWYQDEVDVASSLGITHINFKMSSSKELDFQQVQDLIQILETAPKPVLIHCRAGSDRTGLAAALYLAAVSKAGEERAESQMSVFFGHIGIPFSPTYAMEKTFEAMEPSLGFHDS